MRMNEYSYGIRCLRNEGEELTNAAFLKGYNSTEVFEKTTDAIGKMGVKSFKPRKPRGGSF